MISIKQLKKGKRYQGKGRNFDVAVWDGKKFIGEKKKFGLVFEDTELHYDADPKYGTFQPEKMLDDI
jgi:hypothetical protein